MVNRRRILSWLLVPFLAASAIQCSSTTTEVQNLDENDRLLIDIGPHGGNQSTFIMTITTEQSYGCDSFLTRKLNRTKSGVAIEIIGVVPGEAGCTNQGARPLEEEIKLRFESGISLEVRHRREMDRYRLELDGNGWETERVYNGLGTVLTAAEGD